ncbi:SWIM zinc finger family protein [Phytohabitans kaempferiae]|uniref:SWIM zinc finger family protein n=1 Tax=Phytohabitans kaempferiae TaxID=1620943 RepID=A0ABV6MD92_9ACTN
MTQPPDFREYGRTRPVEGGLKARSARGAIGESWWSRRFLAVLESLAIGSRLTRGRSYARKGQVLSLTVAPGEVSAVVQGSRETPYAVTIGFDRFSAAVWARVEEALAGQALYSARLLAGDVPPELEELFARLEAPLFPQAVADLRMRCTCPDHAVPCKHLAATFYLLAEEFDADPFQLLHWRGRSRDDLLARLRLLRGGGGVDAVSGARGPARPSPPSPIGAAAALADVVDTALEESVDRFWLPPQPLPERPPTPETEPDLLLRQLPTPGPVLGGAGLVARLRPAYEAFAESPAP